MEVKLLMIKKQFNKDYDVFRSFLVEEADYEGYIELPKIKTSNYIPRRLVPFSKAVSRSWQDFDCWVMFYEYDVKFERLWNNPKKYLEKLKRFEGVISPDFSIYRNMPLVMQQWNTYRSRALAVWLGHNGIEVIPNVRFNDERTYNFCFDGIEKNKTVSVSTHGCIRSRVDRDYFKKDLQSLLKNYPQKPLSYMAEPLMTSLKLIKMQE